MAIKSTLEHLTAFEENDRLDKLQERTPEDYVDFRLLYDPNVVSPWSEGPNELVRFYFTAEELNEFYVPITFPKPLEGDMRSTPIGRPMNDDETSWADAGGGDYRIEGNVDIDGHELDVLWYQEADDPDEMPIVVAEIVGTAT